MKFAVWVFVLVIGQAAFAEQIAIVGGTVHTMSDIGTVQDATIVIEDGEIVSVRSGRQLPSGARVIEADGKVLTPGLFAIHTQLGLVEVSAEGATVDAAQRGAQFKAAFDVADAYNPDSSLIAINRVEGITRAMILPYPAYDYDAAFTGTGAGSSGVLSGSAAVVHLGESDDYLVMRKAAVVAHIGETGADVSGGSRAAALLFLQSAFNDAIEYAQYRDDYDAGARRDYSLSKPDLEALQSVVSGETPLYLTANRASDIRIAIEMADRYGLQLIIVGGVEAWKVADRLAASNISVVLSPFDNLPGSFDRLGATFDNARLLNEAGVRVIFSDMDTHNARNITQLAGNAVANGLPWIEGLRAITHTPAVVLGLGDRFGALAPGMVADLVIWDGDPLEVDSYPVSVFIDGVEMSSETRQSMLRDRYLDLSDARQPAYRR